MRVTVAYSPGPRQVREWVLDLPPGSGVDQALQASGLVREFPALDLETAALGIWGRRTGLRQVLREGDRVEVYRPLRVDPKVARRERFRRQGTRGAGLFAKKKAGPQAGSTD